VGAAGTGVIAVGRAGSLKLEQPASAAASNISQRSARDWSCRDRRQIISILAG
jgi:hypothetical protein